MNVTRLVNFNSWSRKCMKQAGWNMLNGKAKTPFGGTDKSLFVMVLTFKWNKQWVRCLSVFFFCPRGFYCKWTIEQKQGSWHSLVVSLSDGQATSSTQCVFHSLWCKSCGMDIQCLMPSLFSSFICGLCFKLTVRIFFDKWYRPMIEQCFKYLIVCFIGIMVRYIKAWN